MKKRDIYQIRTLFEAIQNDFRNDFPRSTNNSENPLNRAELIEKSVNEGVKICNSYLEKMKP